MGQVVTDNLIHEIGNRAPVVVVRAGFHHSTEDVVTPPAECSDYVADMSVMELVSEKTDVTFVFLPVCLSRVILVPPCIALGVPTGDLEDCVLFTDPCKTREYLAYLFLTVAIPPVQFLGLAERKE